MVSRSSQTTRTDPPPPSDDQTSRERFLHDETIQALYGLGLRLEDCIHLVEEAPEQAKAQLDRAITNLNEIISGLRNRIYDLGRRE